MALINCKECGAEISSAAAACPKCGAPVGKAKTQSKPGCGSIGCGVIVVLLLLGALGVFTDKHTGTSSTSGSSVPTSTSTQSPDVIAADEIAVLDTTASKGGFGTVMILTIKLKNNNAFAVKDFQIVCANYAASGTELAASYGTLFEKLKAGQTKTFSNVNLGLMPPESKTYNCKIALVTPLAN